MAKRKGNRIIFQGWKTKKGDVISLPSGYGQHEANRVKKDLGIEGKMKPTYLQGR